jgi:hypothetical protein
MSVYTEKTQAVFTTRRPTLIRVWRSAGPGCPLTSIWLPAELTIPKGGPVQ